MPGVLLVDQSTVQQVEFIGRPGGLLRIDGGLGDAGQDTLPNQAHLRINANPRLSHYHRLGSRPREFRPEPLSEPDVTLSRHPAPVIQPHFPA